MHARNVSIRLRPDSAAEFTKTLENEVIPLLRKQKGFQDEITFVAAGGLEAVAISFWDEKEDAESYNHATYPEVQKALMKVLAGPPHVRTYEVSNSTLHKIAAPAVV
jgi:heme-degrading monooxygenase HmoA